MGSVVVTCRLLGLVATTGHVKSSWTRSEHVPCIGRRVLIIGTPRKSLFSFFKGRVSVLRLVRGCFVMEARWKCLKRDV